MSLEHAILVSLMERAGSGYELARRFDRSIGYFWSASHQQIYRTLKRMADVGWVNQEVVYQNARPDKKVYRPSTEGQEALRAWISEETGEANTRATLAVKLRGASYGDTGALVDQFTHYRDAALRQLSVYREIEARDFPDAESLSGRALHQYLVLRAGILEEQTLAAWCSEVIARLTEVLKQPQNPEHARDEAQPADAR
ncbi:PadR family transcriptional regulator [Hoyosella altamirensis]|uniref:DNA-binding PadR family transcriptional regulator n=1 Tax=Hoyosella altamirensis TaxID=616997 RepID=A0A839RSN3_9ACTN|nr:PadR family transcriptional regulator [Hoyosella altamirensis]MBB3039146.1 DNA-binding PadR family transcriptional regulator [Hoyosella altamirensis]